MANTRQKTKYPGIYFREVKRLGGLGTERVYYVVYKKDGVMKEEKVGRQYADGMTESRANAVRAELIEGKREPRKVMKVRAAEDKKAAENRPTIQKLWEEYKEQRAPSRSLDIDDGRFRNFLVPAFGDKTPGEIITAEVIRLRVRMLKAKKAKQTVKHVLALLRRIILFGVESERIDPPNPRKLKIALPKVRNKKTEMLTDDQYEKLLTAAGSDENWKAGALVLMALATGMRKSEMMRLRWERVNLESGFITLLAEEVKAEEDQQVALNSFTAELLSRIPRTSVFVFPGATDDNPIINLYPALRRIRKAAELPNSMRPLHAWRHVFASRLASDGESLYVIQKLLRHADSRMTERYAHLTDKAVRRASDKVDEDLRRALERGKKAVPVQDNSADL
jgi:integrase